MMEYLFNLQLFAEDGDGEGEPTEPVIDGAQGDKGAEPKYTDADIDRIIGQKFAEWQKKQDKKVSEAERLGKMTAEEKTAERMKALEDKLHGYEVAAAKAEMTKQARAMLADKNLHVGDELLGNLIAEDAETTKASVESFISLFSSAVEKAVKDALKGEPPKTGGSSGMTREQIMNITNRAERQKAIRENINLFK